MSRRDEEGAPLLGHGADNDGIDEYDNPAPMWWWGLFGISVVWGVIYGADYHFVSGHSQEGYYLAEMADAQTRWPDAGKAKAVEMTPEAIAEGEKIFTANCVACHGADLHGGIGPNLIDATWIHGGEPDQIVQTITNGVPEKGMVAWGGVLGPTKISQVAAFVISKYEGGEAAPAEEAPAEVVEAAPVDPNDPLAAGRAIFETNCVACHGADMTGGIGPNLVDTEWIHGGTLDDIKTVITNGVPDKGMITWGPILGEEKVGQVAEYVLAKNREATGEN